MQKQLLSLLLLLSFQMVYAQEVPFNKGINLTEWLQAPSAQQIQFTKFTKTDFEQIQSLGCDVIRLPINLHFMTDGAPDYTIDPLFFYFLDQAVDWAEEVGIYLILDNHTFDPSQSTDPNVGDVLEKVWLQMADRYKNRSDYLLYEVLNEPHGISDALWNAIQQDVIEVIRTVDTKHTIVIGGAGFNSYNNLNAMPVYEDDNLIYTFHFYDPFVFTHQGASWVSPSMEPLAGIPFPYVEEQMPLFPAPLIGSWVDWLFNEYAMDGNEATIQSLLDIAIAFREERNVPIFCGELGVYIPNSNSDDRVRWYEAVRSYLEENDVPWTSWDYQGGFGLFEAGSFSFFDHDLNVPLLEALGFNVPPQSELVVKPDSAGFFIYRDFIEHGIADASWHDGFLNFYNEENPNYGERCLLWDSPSQYNYIGFDFRPDRDLSYLAANDFALDLFIRGDTPGTSFDIRFIDTDTDDPEDRPWRMRVTINDNVVDWDNRWHHLHLPLNSFTEQGAWDDNAWHEPIGAFDWTAIDQVQLVAEQSALSDRQLWFDHVQLTDQDTAIVNDTTQLVTIQNYAEDLAIKLFPNPVQNHLTVTFTTPHDLVYHLIDSYGQTLRSGQLTNNSVIDFQKYPAGIYFLRLESETGNQFVRRLIKY